jgi:hypothetical protein
MRRWGACIAVTSLVGLVISGVAVVVTANACGMFGDGCEEYGSTGAGFELALSAFFLCLVSAVGGLVLILIPDDRSR